METATQHRRALAHAGDTQPGAAGRRAGWGSIGCPGVGDAQHRRTAVDDQLDLNPCPRRVLGGIGQRLLGDPVQAEAGRRRELPSLSMDAEVDRDAGVAEALDEVWQILERGERRLSPWGLFVAQQADRPTDVGQALPAKALGLAQGGNMASSEAASNGASSSICRTDEAISSLSSDLVMAWSYVLSISALRQPKSSTSASRARSRSDGLANNSRTFFTRKVVCKWRIVCGVMAGSTTRIASA
jgi:hypothetical protein